MKAAVLYQTGQDLDVKENISLPKLEKGQVLVELAYSGLCHSQLMEVQGARGEDKYLPHLLGHEGTGIVREVGKGVTKFEVGDRVVLTWIRSKGQESGGVKYLHGDDLINAGAVTTLNEYAVVSENRCFRLPDAIPFDIGVLFGCALPTGAGIVLNEMNLTSENIIVIFGLGGIGMSALVTALLKKPKCVIAVDVEPFKLEFAKDLGAQIVIHAKEEDPLEKIKDLFPGGVDFAIEATGRVETIETAFLSVREKGGLCVFASHPPAGEKIKLDPFDLISGKQIKGSWGGGCDPDRDIPHLMDLYLKEGLPLDRFFNQTYSLNEINQALEDLEKGKLIRALIEIKKDLAS